MTEGSGAMYRLSREKVEAIGVTLMHGQRDIASMMLLDIPSSGKSFLTKLLIVAIALSTDDNIIILNPEGEYTPLVKALGSTVMYFAVGGSNWLNASVSCKESSSKFAARKTRK